MSAYCKDPQGADYEHSFGTIKLQNICNTEFVITFVLSFNLRKSVQKGFLNASCLEGDSDLVAC